MSVELPTIRIVTGEPQRAISQAVAALRSDPDLYVRDTELVHVARTTEEEHEHDPAVPLGSPRIHRMTVPTLRVRMCSSAVWTRTKMVRGKAKAEESDRWEQVRCEPTRAMAEELRDERRWPGFRQLDGVSETPFPRPDGTIVQGDRQYDRATRYLYDPSLRFDTIEDEPTQGDANAAWLRFADLFVDFPFASEACASAVVGTILSMIGRPAIVGPVPGLVLDATTPGTGKSLLADVCAAIAYGRDAGRAHFPEVTGRDVDTELQKRLATWMRTGAPCVNFDNCDNVTIGGDILEQVISAPRTMTFRLLGTMDEVNVPARTVFLFTGNNVSWSRGMNRRIFHVRLESPFADPEKRPLDSYRYPERAGKLFSYALAHRKEYVRDALTILRAYFVAGRPDPLRLGTFEAWAELVPSALVWAGAPSPMGCRPSESGEESPEQSQARALVSEWERYLEATGAADTTAHDVVGRLWPANRAPGEPLDPSWETFRAAIEFFTTPREGKTPDPVKLANVLSKRFRRVAVRTLDPPELLRRLDTRGATGGRARWRVEKVDPAEAWER